LQHFSHLRRSTATGEGTTDRLVQVRGSIVGTRRQRKEKAAMPEHDQAVRLVFFAMLTCILIESASYFFDRFDPRERAKKRNVHTLTNSIT
jgi:hypothetical protein